MKTVSLSDHDASLNALLEQAREEDLLVCAADGAEFVITAVEDFDLEIQKTRGNAKLMALLDERARQHEAVPIADVKRQLGLDS